MDNFSFRNKKKHSTVDGFVVPKRADKHEAGARDLGSFNQYYRPDVAKVSRPDNFAPRQSIDGFTRAMQTPIDNPASREKLGEYRRPFARDAAPRRAEQPLPAVEKRRQQLKRRQHAVPKRRGRLKLGLRLTGVFAGLIILIGGGLLLRGYLTSRGIFKGGGSSALLHNQDVDPSQLKGEGDGRVNVLVLGKGGAEQSDGPDLTDTIIVASIDPLAKEAALLSIPRDFWVKSPGGGQVKINQVYADAKNAALNKYPYKERNSDAAKSAGESAGVDALKRVVSDTMGVPLHYYAMIDFAGFRKAIDTVGGVDINVTEEMAVSERMRLDGYGSYNLNVKPGMQHFDGWKALAFSRSRKTSGRGDFARSERQRAVILALKEKILTVGTLANPVKLNQLMSDFSGQLHTDFSINEMLRLYDLSKEIPADRVVSVGLDEYVTGDSVMVGGTALSIQVPKAGMFDYSAIQNYVRNIMRDAFLKREDAKIVVLNGTATPGLATKKANELKSFGYNVTNIDDAPTKTYTQTVLVNLSHGDSKKYTLNYLQKRLGTTAVKELPDAAIQAIGADFVIVLGTDAVQQ